MQPIKRGDVVRVIDSADALKNCQGRVSSVKMWFGILRWVGVKFESVNLPPFFQRMRPRPIRTEFRPRQLEVCAELDHALSVPEVVAAIAECRHGSYGSFNVIRNWLSYTSHESFCLAFDVTEKDLAEWSFGYGALQMEKAVI